MVRIAGRLPHERKGAAADWPFRSIGKNSDTNFQEFARSRASSTHAGKHGVRARMAEENRPRKSGELALIPTGRQALRTRSAAPDSGCSEPAARRREAHDDHAAPQPQLFHGASLVGFDRLHTDAELPGYFL